MPKSQILSREGRRRPVTHHGGPAMSYYVTPINHHKHWPLTLPWFSHHMCLWSSAKGRQRLPLGKDAKSKWLLHTRHLGSFGQISSPSMPLCYHVSFWPNPSMVEPPPSSPVLGFLRMSGLSRPLWLALKANQNEDPRWICFRFFRCPKGGKHWPVITLVFSIHK